MPERPNVSPYNFVPLEGVPERDRYPGIDRLAPDRYSGTLACELEVETPLFTADHRTSKKIEAGGGRDRTLFRFLRDSHDQPILQGASLRGMVRSVYETASNSCLPLATVSGKSKKAGRDVMYGFADLGDHESCRSPCELCPACRLFGVIHGEELHARARVAFSDGVLSAGALEEKRIMLAELSGPKPHHAGIYGKDGRQGGPIAGRKLYYHHPPSTDEPPGRRWTANDLAEYAPPGARFTFTVSFQNLTAQELADLKHCLVLDPGLGHKFGMAKPLGFGSCGIRLREAECAVYRGGGRYRRWGVPSLKLADLSLEHGSFPGALVEMLRIDKQRTKHVGYLGWKGYQGVRVNHDGEYAFQRPESSQPPRQRVEQKGLSSLAAAFQKAESDKRGKKR